jgi:glycosyltransferase involved in cell wall biosynthesis
VKDSLVSIIIPCYNHADYLREAVASSLAQTYGNIEVIVVNDGSTDPNVASVINQIKKDFPDVVVINQENMGLSGARNAGIDRSQGEYIVPLDADDRIAKDFVAETMMIAKTDSKIGVVATDAKLFGEYEQDWQVRDFSKIRQLGIQQLLATALINKQTYNAVKKLNGVGYNTNLRKGYEDWDFWLSVIETEWEFAFVQKPLFYYRKHGTSMVEEAKRLNNEIFVQVIANHKKLYEEHYPEVITLLQTELNHAHHKIKDIISDQNSESWLMKKFLKNLVFFKK